jgi:ATP-dependent Clp protease protease subunit
MRKPFWKMKNAADNPRVGELSIYGVIGSDDGWSWLFDELTPKQFKADLDELGDIDTLNVMINSPGGDVFAGQAIHSMLRRHQAQVNVYVDGLAASIASVITMAGDRVIMPRNAMLMIHDPFTFVEGNSRDLRKWADTLDTVRESLIAAYQDKTDLTHDELVPLLEAETWLTAEDAVAQGFADEIEETKAISASLVRPGVLAVNGLEVATERYQHLPSTWAALRDAGRPELTKRDAETALIGSGFPRKLAKAIVSGGFSSSAQPAPTPAEETAESETLPTISAERPQLDPVRLSIYRTLIAGALAGAGRTN